MTQDFMLPYYGNDQAEKEGYIICERIVSR